MTYAISVQMLGKQFRRNHADRPFTLQETFVRGIRSLKSSECFWALHDVTFALRPGGMLGIVGPNGAGKSTLLQLIGGVGRPDRGRIQVHGRIGALFDLGAGFHGDLTGRENLFIGGVISGLTRSEVAQHFETIVSFAELESFIDSPLRTYSTGMRMRLAFAVAAHAQPEILLIDEVLAVGDLAFQQKCINRIKQFKAQGCTIVLVSHNTSLIRELCDEALWLSHGRVVADGSPNQVMDEFVTAMTLETQRRTPAAATPLRTHKGIPLQINQNRFGSMELEIMAVELLDLDGNSVAELDSGQSLQVQIEFRAKEPIRDPIFGVTLARVDGQICFETSTNVPGLDLPIKKGEGRILLYLDQLDLEAGQYYVDVGAYVNDWAYAYDYHWHAYSLILHRSAIEVDPSHIQARWTVSDPTQPLRNHSSPIPAQSKVAIL